MENWIMLFAEIILRNRSKTIKNMMAIIINRWISQFPTYATYDNAIEKCRKILERLFIGICDVDKYKARQMPRKTLLFLSTQYKRCRSLNVYYYNVIHHSDETDFIFFLWFWDVFHDLNLSRGFETCTPRLYVLGKNQKI